MDALEADVQVRGELADLSKAASVPRRPRQRGARAAPRAARPRRGLGVGALSPGWSSGASLRGSAK